MYIIYICTYLIRVRKNKYVYIYMCVCVCNYIIYILSLILLYDCYTMFQCYYQLFTWLPSLYMNVRSRPLRRASLLTPSGKCGSWNSHGVCAKRCKTSKSSKPRHGGELGLEWWGARELKGEGEGNLEHFSFMDFEWFRSFSHYFDMWSW